MGLQKDSPAYDDDLLLARCEKAKRVLFKPLAREFQNDICVDAEDQGLTVQTIVDLHCPSPNDPVWGKGLTGLQARLGEICSASHHLDIEAVGHAFPPRQDDEWQSDPRYCARGLLFYLVHEFLGILFSEGKIICLAEDSGLFSFVSYGSLFSEFSGSYDPPHEYDLWMPFHLDAEDLMQSGADALWFAFTRDFAEIFMLGKPEWWEVAAQCPEWPDDPLKAPFVQEVVELVLDENISISVAAQRIVDRYGHSPKGVNYKRGSVVGFQYQNAVENISRPAGKILNYLRKS